MQLVSLERPYYAFSHDVVHVFGKETFEIRLDV